MITVTTPYPQFAELDGSPLDNGAVYIGTAGLNSETNPIAVFWDNAGTQPAAQPLTTRAGLIARNGAPARVYVNAAAYSLLVKDKQGRLIAYEASISSAVGTDNIDNGSITEAKLATAVTDKLNGALQRTGGTMTGAIVLAGNAAAALQPVPLQQAETLLASAAATSLSGLTMSATGTNANVTVAASELLLRAPDGTTRLVTGLTLGINTATVGIDTSGTLASSTWYSVWIVYNTSTAQIEGRLSLSGTAPTFPANITHRLRVGWVRTDSTASKFPFPFLQTGSRVDYMPQAGTNLTGYLSVAGGGTAGTVSLVNFMPPGSRLARLVAQYSATNTVAITLDGGVQLYVFDSGTGPAFLRSGFEIVSASRTFIGNVAGAAAVSITGWQDNL